MCEGPIFWVVKGRKAGRKQTADMVECRGRVEIGAAYHDEIGMDVTAPGIKRTSTSD